MPPRPATPAPARRAVRGGAAAALLRRQPARVLRGGPRLLRERYLPALAEHVEPVDPWSLTQPEEFAAARAEAALHAFGIEVGARNAAAIRGRTC